MRPTKKIPILMKYPRHPDAEYHVEAATTPGYVFIKMFRSGRRAPESPTIYRLDHLPKWMEHGMRVLDFAHDAGTGEGVIPGLGQLRKGVYTFYKLTNP